MKLLSPPLVLLLFLIPALTAAQEPLDPQPPQLAPASDEGQLAMARFRVPAGWKVKLFAAEPLLANPVAFAFDEQGRVFVCETYRQNRGVTDNRDHDEQWLNADLAAQTVEDRLAYHRRLLGESVNEYAVYDDRLRLVADTDGDGVADHSTVFADHFHQIAEGTGAGVLAYHGNVYYTCIPNLWLLRDTNNDGTANERTVLHSGYGVRVAFRGHDLHGLCLGPDGRLYFSVGDRGYHVELPDRTLADPESGAVFRCNLDGSELEVFATGLRNPQELAFDDFGNLFTGDNNSDSGDEARWVYLVAGGDSGWRMAYQYLPDRGPFNREKIWHPFHPQQPAYIVPPVANVADGPSGLAYYPGTGLDDRFRGCFFLCDFRGSPVNSGVRTLRVEQRGAFFELVQNDETFWNILATDVDFGPDGGLYVADWVNGWNGEGKGRIYRAAPEDARQAADPRIAEVRTLLKEGFADRSPQELGGLLAHADRRVRQEAQFALAAKGSSDVLLQVARQPDELLARLHGLWGIGQILRQHADQQQLLSEIIPLLNDPEPEVRAQTARVISETKTAGSAAADELMLLLADDNLRVRQFAAESLGKIADPQAFQALVQMLVDNADQDPIVRHAGIMGLAGVSHADPQRLAELATHSSRAARTAAVVALRKLHSPLLAVYLKDADPSVVVEAARAIHDLPIPTAMESLAGLLDQAPNDDALLRRVLSANYRAGQAQHALAIARFAARNNVPDELRREAVLMVATWAQPLPRDRVLGMWRPLDGRDVEPARTALQQHLPGILSSRDERVRTAALDAAAKLQLGEAGPLLKAVFAESTASGSLRAAALAALGALRDRELKELATVALGDSEPQVRIAARRILIRMNPLSMLDSLLAALDSDDLSERQATLATLAEMRRKEADQLIAQALERMLADQYPADTRLDVLEAAQARRSHPRIDELLSTYQQRLDPNHPLSAYQECLYGGDAHRGQQLFFERTEVSCVRCHRVGERGGEVGPDLTKIAEKKDRRYLLEAIVDPNKAIAENYQSAVIVDDQGRVLTGIVKREDDTQVELMTAEGALITVLKEAIDERSEGLSAMPQDVVKHLSPRDVRDLVEWLAGLK